MKRKIVLFVLGFLNLWANTFAQSAQNFSAVRKFSEKDFTTLWWVIIIFFIVLLVKTTFLPGGKKE